MALPINKIKSAIKLLKQLKFYMHRPKKVDAVIFYLDRDFLIREYVLEPIGFSSVSIDPIKVNVHYQVLIKLFALFTSNIAEINKRKLLTIFAEAHILSYNPKAVITLMDDCGIFSELSKFCHRTEFYAIQNGTRTIWQLKREYEQIYLTNFFCFGEHVIDTYKRYNKIIKEPLLTGSFIADIYYYNNKKQNIEKKDICLIDHWVERSLDVLYGTDSSPYFDDDYVNSLKTLDEHLSRYVKETGCSITIGARGDDLRTIQHYKELFGDNVYGKKEDWFSTYEAMINSSLIIGTCSTTLSESLGWGKKVLFYDLTQGQIYSSCTENGLWNINSDSYKQFKERVNKILSMTAEEYRKEVGWYSNYRMRGPQDKKKEASYKMMQDVLLSNS